MKVQSCSEMSFKVKDFSIRYRGGILQILVATR